MLINSIKNTHFMAKITIKDLAKLLSVSVSTISRALADHPDISKDTKVRIKNAAAHYNYMPNLHARYFRKKNTKMIALILPGFNRFFIPDLIEGIQKMINDNGYTLIIFQSTNSPAMEEEIVKYCLSWVVEGVLIALSDNTTNLDHLSMLADNNIPVVLLDKILKTDLYSTVTIDDYDTARKATQALFDSGKNNILGVFGHQNVSITKERLEGFKAAILENSVKYSSNQTLIIDDITTAIDKISKEINKNIYDGVFFMTDELLVNGYNIILQSQKKIPDDIGIVSISDGTSPYFLTPNVTHIFHSGFEVGKTACELLFKNLDGRIEEIEHLQIDTTLVDLGSI
jgi:LacI family transcriptional regulator